MTGLDKILRHIGEEAELSAQKEIAQANKRADEILAAARREADEKCEEILEQSQNEIKSSLSRSESAANLQEKKMILNTKQEIISEVIQKAKESLTRLPDQEYFERILTMVKKYAMEQKGQILFSAADRNRLPENFGDSLKIALTGKKEAELTVSGLTADIDGGFILDYGDIEVNCSFEALISAARENLQDKVRRVLFQ